jgi:D-alanyl-D-alanine dipeptidase
MKSPFRTRVTINATLVALLVMSVGASYGCRAPDSDPADAAVLDNSAAEAPETTDAADDNTMAEDIPDGEFRIVPLRDIEELRAEAMAAAPPVEQGSFRGSELVELTKLDPTIRLDIRYATDNNFMGSRMYEEARAFLQRPAAEALVRVNQALEERGLGVIVYDGYRPWYVTKMFFEATPVAQRQFVANPADGSRHNRGCAVDLGLYDRATGDVLPMPSGYDEFSDRAFPDYAGGTTEARANREVLREAMEAEGFTVYEFEWWHFDYVDWRDYRIGNMPFAEIGNPGS